MWEQRGAEEAAEPDWGQILLANKSFEFVVLSSLEYQVGGVYCHRTIQIVSCKVVN